MVNSGGFVFVIARPVLLLCHNPYSFLKVSHVDINE